MAFDYDDLDPAFADKVRKTITDCAGKGVVMVPYFGLRTPFEQGKLWRQSRTLAQIDAKLSSLRNQGADFLAHCIESVGPQQGPHVTGAIPGLSWHQWGEAVDCYWRVGDGAEWDTSVGGAKNGYRIYAAAGTARGLTAGGYWQSLKDWPHLQQRHDDSPDDTGMSLVEIDAAMRDRFG